MTTLYTAADGLDFDDKYEQDSDGISIPGFYAADGVTLLKYAPLSKGGRTSDAGYYHPEGPDVSNYWAGKGTVTYTVASMSDLGRYTFPMKQTGAAGHVESWNETYSSVEFTLRRNGTWAFYLYDTNYYNDKSMVSSPGGRTLLNYPEGVLLASGNWAQVPSSNFGDSYTVDFELEQYEWGWHNFPTTPATETNTIFSANTVRGSWTLPVSGGVDGLGTNIPVNTDVTVRGRLGLDALGNGNGSYEDKNGGLSHYARGIIKVTIKRGGVQVLQFRVNYCLEGRYSEMKVTNSANTYTYANRPDTPTGAPYLPIGGITHKWDRTPPSGGGGGGGGGGCVVTDALIYSQSAAGDVAVFDKMLLTDPYSRVSDVGVVTYSETELQPCVAITTKLGATLHCSTTAPIPTLDHGFIVAPELLGHRIPVASKEQLDRCPDDFVWDEVIEVVAIGDRQVQHITVGDRCFWASMDDRYYILHHNLKAPPSNDNEMLQN